MKNYLRQDKGVTLVELLATLVISSIILLLIFSIFGQVMKAGDDTVQQTNKRNEMVFICKQLDNAMLNVNTIEILDETGSGAANFHHFKGIEHRTIDNPNKDQVGEPVFQQVEHARTDFKLADGNLYIDDVQINNEGFTLEGTTFSLKNSGLSVKLQLKHTSGDKRHYIINKFYDLKSE